METPKKTLTVQLQLEYDHPLDPEFVKDIQEAARRFADVLRTQGYTRFEVYMNNKALEK